jgi:hypothetical protein
MPRKNPITAPDPRQAALDAWLDKHNARLAWDRKQPNGTIVACWIIGTGVAITMRYPKGGWDIFTGCGQNEIAATLADAEQRLGLAEPVEHEWTEAHVYGEDEPPIWRVRGATCWTENVDKEPCLVVGDDEGVAVAYLSFPFVRERLAAHRSGD